MQGRNNNVDFLFVNIKNKKLTIFFHFMNYID